MVNNELIMMNNKIQECDEQCVWYGTLIPKSWLKSARARCLSSIFLLVFLMAWTEHRGECDAGGSSGSFWCHTSAEAMSLLRKTRWTVSDWSTWWKHAAQVKNHEELIRTFSPIWLMLQEMQLFFSKFHNTQPILTGYLWFLLLAGLCFLWAVERWEVVL